jgi:hypothetical protein
LPSFDICVFINPPLDKGRKYLQEISTVVISSYFPIALITATIIAVSAALTMACPQMILPALTSFHYN